MDHRLTLGQVMFSYSIVGVLFATIEHLAPSLITLQEALVSAERLMDFQCEDNTRETVPAQPRQSVRGDIELVDVHFWHRRAHPILKGVHFEITAGQTVAVFGQTGVGKTTLANIIGGLYPVTHGTVLIDRHRVHTNLRTLREAVAIVFQDGGIVDGTIHDNIALGLRTVSRNDVRRAAQLAMLDEFVSSLPKGYDHQVGTLGHALSSGQRQRIAIARALLRSPRVLIMDEATSNLDSVTERAILDNIRRVRHGRATTILVTHRLQIALRTDKVIVLEDGRVVEVGTHESLIGRGGPYHRLWSASYLAPPPSASGSLARSRGATVRARRRSS